MEHDPYSLDDLRHAVRQGQTLAVAEILDAAPTAADAASARGGSLLLEAHERELPAISELFLSAREHRGTVALDVHEAASLGRPGTLRRVLTDEPLAFEAVGPAGFLPLHRAAYRGHLDAARLLLEAGADANARSENGAALTALHSAVAGAARFQAESEVPSEAEDAAPRYAQMVRLLVSAGADRTARMEGDWTPLDAARRDGLAGLAELLQPASRGIDPQDVDREIETHDEVPAT